MDIPIKQTNDANARASKVRLVVFDVDGVLTSGQIAIGKDGEVMKEFFVQDGLGIAVTQRAGIKTAIITGRESEMVRLRSAELKICDVYQGTLDKQTALRELMDKHGLGVEEVAYVGDDLNDLPALVQVGFACGVANSVPEVAQRCHYISAHRGGGGGVRDVLEFILRSQGLWDGIVQSYVEGSGQQHTSQ